jgi:hypothetical protein
MKLLRLFVATAAILAPTASLQAAEDEMFGNALTLVELFVRSAAQSDDPKAQLKAIDDVLAGRNAEANRALAGLFQEVTSDMAPENKDRVAAIGRDLAAVARKEAAKTPPPSQTTSGGSALQARKDLTEMGLRYYDPAQYLDAVKRDDALAVELFLRGRGVNPSARDAGGRSALDIARENKNEQIARLIAGTSP